jgi:hypothetical protein
MTTTTFTSDLDTVHMPLSAGSTRRPDIDAGRLWTGGLATALVAALIGLVGVLILQVIATHVPEVHAIGALGTSSATVLLCTIAAVAALAATGIAHLLLASTPRPMAYLGWIVGLATAAAAVLPLTTGAPLVVALAEGVINLVIGLAIGSLVAGAAYAAARGTSAR